MMGEYKVVFGRKVFYNKLKLKSIWKSKVLKFMG